MSFINEQRNIEGFKTKLRQSLPAAGKVSFEDAWAEFNSRCKKSPAKPILILDDLLWEIEVGRWPKKRFTPLNDTDPFPFGKHGPSGEHPRTMINVPASYYHYLWTHGMKDNKTSPVADYIRRSLKALKAEHPDGIW